MFGARSIELTKLVTEPIEQEKALRPLGHLYPHFVLA
jgi:hypothetical protein